MKRDLTVLLLVCVLATGWLLSRSLAPSGNDGRLDTTALLNDAPEEFRRVTGPRSFEFPRDHAAHRGVRNEWWYFTGNLDDREGRRFGLQFTLFRFAIVPETLRSGSSPATIDDAFAADAVWMAHLAVSDVAGRRFLNRERFARGALDLAGATEDRWWLRDWEVRRTATGWRLEADAGEFAVDLELEMDKPIVLQGDSGYSQKGPAPGNASHYYSITRLGAAGQLRIEGRPHVVSGTLWLDREWGSSQLGPGIEGWDWFALQFDDGRDLMVYRLRTETGEASAFSSGALVERDGTARILTAADFRLLPGRRWRDSTGVEWPLEWRVEVPSAGLDVAVRPAFDAQLWDTQVRYWEGAVDVLGDDGPEGRGYLELSGYGAGSRAARR